MNISPNHIKRYASSESVNMDNEWFELNDPDHFWMKARMRYLIKLMKHQSVSGHFLDIGCGTGATIQSIEAAIDCIIDGADLDETLLQLAPKINGQLMVLNVMNEVPELDEKYDAMFLLDVIEHIENDTLFLENAMRLLKPGGLIFINVPSFQWLYSKYDSKVGHQRRYTVRTLSRCAEENRLEILEIRYWGMLLTPLVALRKLILSFTPEKYIIKTGFREPSRTLANFLNRVCEVEFTRFSHQPIGTSCLGVFRKPN